MAENMGKGPGAEFDTQWGSGNGGCILVQMALGSGLGRRGRSTELVAGELLLSAAQKISALGIEQLCSLTPSLTPPNEM